MWSEYPNNKNSSHIKINGNENALIHMMTAVPVPLHTAIEFLEWLLEQEISANDVYKMPMCVFEQLAKEFLIENKGVIENTNPPPSYAGENSVSRSGKGGIKKPPMLKGEWCRKLDS